MDRYSIVYGTNKAGAFGYVAVSPGLDDYLQKVGSINSMLTVDCIFEFLAGFTKKDGYSETGKNNAPMAVRYSPLYLNKLQSMPANLQPINVITINGLEYRDKNDGIDQRETVYSHAILVDRKLLLHSEKNGFSYLDQIFGTHLTNWQEIRDFRRGSHLISLDAAPSYVAPVQLPRDKAIVLRAVEAVYLGKCAVIRVDSESSFNERCISLLTQIYGLIQPRLAAELGFATYVDVPEIRKLQEKTNIRIFLMPPNCSDIGLPSDCVLIDTENPVEYALENEKLSQALQTWYNMPWKERREAMETLFLRPELENQYLKADVFADTTMNFIRDPLFAWMRSKEDLGTVKTLRELRELKARFAACEVPWCSEMFDKRIPELLAKGTKLTTLLAQGFEAARSLENRGEQIPPEVRDDFYFARSLKGLVDYSKDYYQIVSDNSKKRLELELSSFREQHEIDIGEKNKKINDLSEKLIQARIDAEREKKMACSAAERDFNERVNVLKKQHEKEIKEKDTKAEETLLKEYNKIYTKLSEVLHQNPEYLQTSTLEHAQSEVNALIDTIKGNKTTLEKEKSDIEDKLEKAEKQYMHDLSEQRTKYEKQIEALERKKTELEGKMNRHQKRKYKSKDDLKGDKESDTRLKEDNGETSLALKILLGVLATAMCVICLIVFLPKSANSGEVETEPALPSIDQTTTPRATAAETAGTVTTESVTKEVDTKQLIFLLEESQKAEINTLAWDSVEKLRIAEKNALDALNLVPAQQGAVDTAVDELQEALNQLRETNWQEIISQIPEIRQAAYEDYDQDLPIELGDKTRFVAAISIDEPLINPGIDENEETSNEYGEENPSRIEKGNVENYAIILQGPLTQQTAEGMTDAKFILHYGNVTVFCYGSENMMLSAIKLMDLAAPYTQESKSLDKAGIDDGYSKYMLLRLGAEGKETFIPLLKPEKNAQWWRGITHFSGENDVTMVKAIKERLRITGTRNAVYAINSDQFDSIVIDYGEDIVTADKCVALFDPKGESEEHSWRFKNYVVIVTPAVNNPSGAAEQNNGNQLD